MHESSFIATSTGAKLWLRRYLSTRPRGVVQINHDLAEHGGRYEAFARYLAGNGFHAYAHDHRGHGKTEAPGASRGSLGLARVEAELFDLHEFIAAEHPGLPVIIFGQGAGALISYRFLVGHAPRLAGAALWNMPAASDYPVRFLSAMLRWERFRLGSDVPSPTMRRMVAGWNRKASDKTPFDSLSDDPSVVEDYVGDPLSGTEPTIATWLDMLRLTRQAGSERGWSGLPRDLPLNVAAGDADPLTGFGRQAEGLERRLKGLGFDHVAIQRHEGQRHDLVNGLSREAVWRGFADWAETVTSR